MRTLLNVLWLVFGGLMMALAWWLAGAVLFVTVIGIPWSRACFVIGTFALWPFGRQVADRDWVTGRGDIGTGALGTLGNIIWLVVAGIWLAIGHVSSALACFVSIIGIPFGLQHLKLAVLTLAPIGKTITTRP